MNDNDMIRRGDALMACGMVSRNDEAAFVENLLTALPAATVRVRPLVWEGDGHWRCGDKEGWIEEANTAFGWGYVVEFGTAGQSHWIVSSTFGETLKGFDDPAAAKAAAQADYEARIRAALEPVDAPAALTPTAVGDSQAADPVVNDPAMQHANALSPEARALIADVARGPMEGERVKIWVRCMMGRAAETLAMIQKGTADDRA